MNNIHHAIKVVAKRTGLSPHVIRVWERRYRAVEPERSATQRRLYSDNQIERLTLLRDITRAGHTIGNVAQLSTENLRSLAKEIHGPGGEQPPPKAAHSSVPAFLDECVAAVKALDARGLEETLQRAATKLGAQGLLQRVIAPLAETIGELWRGGLITAAHEHFASSVIRVFLGHAARPFSAAENSPVLIVATPTGQLHELGALLAGAAAANIGWHVTYLGASLPAPEIAGAARQNRARAVALSLVYPSDDPRLEGELTRLRELLPAEVPIIAGGRATPAYRDTLEKIAAFQMKDLTQLCDTLDGLRAPTKTAKR